jgi:hypothetical protein
MRIRAKPNRPVPPLLMTSGHHVVYGTSRTSRKNSCYSCQPDSTKLSVCLYVCLSACRSVCLSVSLSLVCLSVVSGPTVCVSRRREEEEEKEEERETRREKEKSAEMRHLECRHHGGCALHHQFPDGNSFVRHKFQLRHKSSELHSLLHVATVVLYIVETESGGKRRGGRRDLWIREEKRRRRRRR